jgi:Cu/Ag efflux pump CusA
MNLSKLFINRPVFAGVLSVLILVAGLLALRVLPISEYPEVVPPSVIVRALYPGANPKVIAETVATPIEEAINGVEGMLYMSSQATTDGLLTLTVTFRLGTDPDKAQQLVQNRVAQAEPRLPEEVRRLGVTTVKSSPDLTMVVHLLSPNNRYDMTYLRNYAVLHIKDRLARVEGVGQVEIFGAGDYSMRVWLDPQKVSERGLSASDVVREIRAQNLQPAAGVIGAPPSVPGLDLQLSINAQGRLQDEEEFGNIIVGSGPNGEITRLRDIARIELGAANYSLRSLLDNKTAVGVGIFQAPGSNALEVSRAVREVMAELKGYMPEGCRLPDRLRHDPIRSRLDRGRGAYAPRSRGSGRDRSHSFSADVAGIDHSAACRSHIHHRHLRGIVPPRLLHKRAQPVRPGAGDRHCRRRRYRRGGKCRAQHRGRILAARSNLSRDARGLRPDHRDCHRPCGGVHSPRLHQRTDRPIL